ncbi:hypothetical protein ACIG3E_32590 [Streptomyces sp. NPDC053474]|uniref:hypothetical protein n=1 Tax=Streptomyces sp. NPDC053474 TaxID=3365704 RepID=UPI0037CF635B
MSSSVKIPSPTSAQTIRAVRSTDFDGKDYWFCSFSGSRIGTFPGRSGHFCPGCNVIAPRIVRVRSYGS